MFLPLLDPGVTLFLIFSTWLLSFAPFADAAVNRTIDDSLGDSVTNAKVQYSPQAAWDNQNCGSHCSLHPPISQAFKGTYTATTFTPQSGQVSITMKFTGTAIYVFFVLGNNAGSGPITFTAANFTLDGKLGQLFTHTPDSNNKNFSFNQTVFQQENLDNIEHTLIISSSGPNKSYVNFDYAIYTSEDDGTASLNGAGGNSVPMTVTKTQTSTRVVINQTTQSTTTTILTSPSLPTSPLSSASTTLDSVTPTSSEPSIRTTILSHPMPTSTTGSSTDTTPSNTTVSRSSNTAIETMMLSSSSVTAPATSTSDIMPPEDSSGTRVSKGPVVGGVIGGLSVVPALMILVCLRKRYIKRSKATNEGSSFPQPTPEPTFHGESSHLIGRIVPFILQATTYIPSRATIKSRTALNLSPSRLGGSLNFLNRSVSREPPDPGHELLSPVRGPGETANMDQVEDGVRDIVIEQLNTIREQIAHLQAERRPTLPTRSGSDAPPPYLKS